MYQYSNRAPWLLGQNCNLSKFLVSQFPKTTPKLEVCPESFRTMLDYIDISNMAYFMHAHVQVVHWDQCCVLKVFTSSTSVQTLKCLNQS